MDRHAKKLEKKRKQREQTKRKAGALAARRPSGQELLMRAAARQEFGPCLVSATWDDLSVPALVSVLVTRTLPSGHLLPALVLVDRTCLGIKDALTRAPMARHDFEDFVAQVGVAHGGMTPCEPLVAQSLVFHALDYARSLGFEPHSDFPAALFGSRPPELLSTPWCTPERPIYIPGPRDDVFAITRRLTNAVGADGFHQLSPFGTSYDDEDDDEDRAEDPVLIHSPLECTVSRDDLSVRVSIYRVASESTWHLEVEDQRGGSTIWDDQFETDQAALDAAMLAIETNGIRSFLPPSAASAE